MIFLDYMYNYELYIQRFSILLGNLAILYLFHAICSKMYLFFHLLYKFAYVSEHCVCFETKNPKTVFVLSSLIIAYARCHLYLHRIILAYVSIYYEYFLTNFFFQTILRIFNHDTCFNSIPRQSSRK